MEKLKEKTFYTIFLIISSFLIIIIIFFNAQNYKKEYEGIKNNLTRMNTMIKDAPKKTPSDNYLNNKIIMDYNIYTFILNHNNIIIDKISHSEINIDSDKVIEANKIIKNNDDSKFSIKCLYFSDVSYNFKYGESLILIDTSNIRNYLLSSLFISLIVLILFESLVYHICKKITKWITDPAKDAFLKQKEFIADASHELKTPLAVITLSTDCIDITKKNEKYINNIKTESERMNNLITKLLDLSKSENKDNRELYSLNDLSKIVTKRVLVFESLAYENKVSIESDIEENIIFKCNKNDIDEVISILIDNAIKHSYKDSTIKVHLYKEKNNIILDITNTGDEIPNEELTRIFERFYRSDKSRNRDTNRYGLGLAIAKNIINNHTGEIKVFSKNNLTTFKVILKSN